ncbi:MAG: toll/interleukin-1 receptor domain-containing protein [Methanoregula sp.]
MIHSVGYMDLETAKQRILVQLKANGVLTGAEIIACLDGDKDLSGRVRKYLVANKYATEADPDSLVYLERDPPVEKKPSPAVRPDTRLQVDANVCEGKKEDVLKPPHFVFISYGRKQDEVDLVTRLKKDLLNSKITSCQDPLVPYAFLDLDNIDKAEVFDKKIEDKIEESTVFLAVISPHAIRKESICRDETMYAYNNQKPIVPLMFRFEKNSKLPLLLCRRNWIDFSGEYSEAFSTLCRYLAGDPTAAKPPLHPIILGKEPLDFGPEIARYSDNYTERPWIDKKISDWIQYSPNPGFVIVGNPGSGKSAISAWLSRSWEDQVIGIHFCSSLNPRSLIPMEFVGNLVAQLFTQIPEYAGVMKEIERYTIYDNATRAFRELVIEPLMAIKNPEFTPKNPKIIIVDSFDEAVLARDDNIFTLLLQQIDYLPRWLRIIATTRPEKGIVAQLGSKFTVLDLSESDNRVNNNEDISRYIDAVLKKEVVRNKFGKKTDALPAFKKALVRQSDGIFLYAVYVMKAIIDGDIDPRRPEMFPKDLVGFYLRMFQKKFPKDENYAPAKKVLGVIIAAKEPLDSAELARFLDDDPSEIESALRPISSLFIRNSRMQYRLFHNSLREWLKGDIATEKKYEDSQFRVNLTEGNRIITNFCWKEFENGVPAMSPYAVAYLPTHLMDAKRYQDLLNLFKNPRFFIKSWETNEFTVKFAWAGIEKNSDFRMIDSYKDVIATPSRYPDEFVMAFSEFLTDTGHHNESIVLLEHVLKIYIRQLNEEKIESCLSSLAWSLYNVHLNERSRELLRLHEFICKNRDDLFNLQIGIGYQANIASTMTGIDLNNQQEHYCRILGEKGKYWAGKSIGNRGNSLWGIQLTELAYRLYQEKEEISKEISDFQGLQWAYGYQADYFLLKGDKKQALELYSKQYDLAQSISYFRGMKLSLLNQKKIFESDGDTINAARIDSSLLALDQDMGKTSITISKSNADLFEELEKVCAARELEYAQAHDDRGLLTIYPYKAFLLEMKKEYEKALQVYDELEKIGNVFKSPSVVNNARRNAWRVYCLQGDIRHAVGISEMNPDAFSPIWAKYDFLNFLDLMITFMSGKGESGMVESFLNYQWGFAERDLQAVRDNEQEKDEENSQKERQLIIPFRSFLEQIRWAGEKNDIARIIWLASHKTEFDMAVQVMALNKISLKELDAVIGHTKDLALAYYSHGYFAKSFAVYDSLNGYYTITEDRVAAEKTLGEMGLNKEALGEFSPALAYYNEQAEISYNASLFEDYVWAVSNQGDVLRKLGRLDKARESYEEVEKVSREKGIAFWLKRARENIGEVHKDFGHYRESSVLFEKIHSSGDPKTPDAVSHRALDNLADISYRTGDLKKAGELYLRAADQLSNLPDLFDQWRVLTKCAVIHDTLGEQDRYAACIQRKRQIVPSIQTDLLFAYLLTNQDHFHTIRFDLELMYEWYEKNKVQKELTGTGTQSGPILAFAEEFTLIQPEEFAMIQKLGDLCRDHKFEMGLQYYYGFEGLYETFMNDRSAARFSFTRQQEQCKKIGYREGLQTALGRIADIFFEEGDNAHAKSFTEEQLALATDLKSQESLLRGGQRLVDIMVSGKEYGSAKKHLEQIHASAGNIGSCHQILMSTYKLGLVSRLSGSCEEARKYFKTLSESANTSKDRYFSALAAKYES